MRIDELKPGQKQKFVPSNTAEGHTFTTFLNQCSDSIAAVKQAKGFLYRGVKSDYDIFIGRAREDRRPMDTGEMLHKELDNLFSEAGFTALRSNSIFCSGDINTADTYGSLYLIFPINGFSFTWSPKIDDLYNYMQGRGITSVDSLYEDQDTLKKIRNVAAKVSDSIDKIVAKRKFDEVSDAIYDFTNIFSDMKYASSAKEISKLLMMAHKTASEIEQKHKIKLKIVLAYISKIDALLKFAMLTPDQILSNLQFTDKDFAAAIGSYREIVVHGEYYAFLSDKYEESLTNYFFKGQQ